MSCKFCEGTDETDCKGWAVFGKPAETINFCPMCGEALAEPEPLTLEELKGMDGQPVWVIPYRCTAEWAIVNVVDNCAVAKDSGVYRLDRCNERAGLLAYRRPPKEAAP